MLKAEKGEDDGEIPDDLSPFHHPVHYVIRTWLEHRLHHTYPRAGGYDDQDAHLMDDWHTVSMYMIRVEKGVFSQMRIPTDAPDISTLMSD